MRLSAYIFDDDRYCVNIFKKIFADNFSQIDIIGHSRCHGDIEKIVTEVDPDIIFLDLDIGSCQTFEMLQKLYTNAQLIFISSEGKHALDAFRCDALDFILKPMTKDRCIAATHKAVNKIQSMRASMGNGLLTNSQWARSFLTVAYMDRIEIVHIDDILCCSAEGRCTRFKLRDGRQLVSSKNLAEYANFFDQQDCFLKVSRSSVVNFKFINKVIKKDGMHCVFNDGSIVPVARRKYNELYKFLNTFTVAYR